jgi:hypothetical protein
VGAFEAKGNGYAGRSATKPFLILKCMRRPVSRMKGVGRAMVERI